MSKIVMKSFSLLNSGETKYLFLAIPRTITNRVKCCNFAPTMRKSNIIYIQKAICTIAIALSASSLSAQDSVSHKRLEGSIYTEVNYGHRHGEQHPTVTDFPHIIGSATLDMGKGWSAVAEVEYERFRTDGSWQNNFRDNYTTNKLYINKSWSEALNVKGGIIDIPVGTTNSGGPALTIYDPLSESTLMPMTWHEGGAALWGSYKRVHYEIGGYVYTAAPLKRSRLLSTAARVGYKPIDGLDMSLSAFYGSTKDGMLQRQNAALAEYGHMAYMAFDFAYLAHGWVIDGQALAANRCGYKATGLEAGYDLATLAGITSCNITPFARYDGYYHVNGVSCNKWTIGLNTSLPLGFTFKAEAGWMNPSNDSWKRSIDISIGWVL